mgnify:CR=1 FL=1
MYRQLCTVCILIFYSASVGGFEREKLQYICSIFPNQSKRNKSTFGDGSVCLGWEYYDNPDTVNTAYCIQIVIVLHIVTQWLHKEYYLNIAALVVLGVYIVVNESGFGMLADNSTKTILIPAIIMIFVMAEVLISKMLDVWKDAKESAEIFAEKERERKRRRAQEIIFSGKLYQTFLSDGLAQF